MLEETQERLHDWGQLSNQLRTQWIVEAIMGWTWYDDWESFASEYCDSLAGSGPVKEWPAVYWSDGLVAWVYGDKPDPEPDEIERPFLPLESMVSIWEVLQALQRTRPALFAQVATQLLPELAEQTQETLLAAIIQWTPAQICAAIYSEYREKEEH